MWFTQATSYEPMFSLKVDIRGLEKARKEAKKIGMRVLQKSMLKMEELAIAKAPFDRGEIRENITLFPEFLDDLYILTSAAPHSAAIEEGTRPFYAPIAPLTAWANRKFGDPSIGYAVRAKIAKYGITAQPFMRPAFWEVETYWKGYYMKEELEKARNLSSI